MCGMLLRFQEAQQKDAVSHQDDSDLEKKRRETEALLQSVGITTDVASGVFVVLIYLHAQYLLLNTVVIVAKQWQILF